MDRIFDVVGVILNFADDRARAWMVTFGGILATVGAWWFALSRSTALAAADNLANQSLSAADRVLVAVALLAPFVLVNAAWQAMAPEDGAETQTETGAPMAGWLATQSAERRRHRLLVAASAGVLNGFCLYVATH